MIDTEFAVRFSEACGTAQPAKIQQLLNISYQAAKNYLGGRVPNAEVLLKIAERTPYSIDWLLTGRGKKFALETPNIDTPPPAGQIEHLVKSICVEVFNELNAPPLGAQPRTVRLGSGDVLSEKVVDETTLSRR